LTFTNSNILEFQASHIFTYLREQMYCVKVNNVMFQICWRILLIFYNFICLFRWRLLLIPLANLLVFINSKYYFNFPQVQLLLSHCSLCTTPLHKQDHTFGLLSAQLGSLPLSCLWTFCCGVNCWRWTALNDVFITELKVIFFVYLNRTGIDSCTLVQWRPWVSWGS
jgi:hypothetical protein